MRKKRFSLAQLLLAIALTAAAVLGCGLLAVRAWMGEGGRSLVEGLRLVNTLFVGEYDETEVVDAALEGMVSGLGDRWSYYLTADELEAQNQRRTNQYVGVGITVNYTREEGLYILGVEAGGPAEAAGLEAGEVITAVDGVSLAGEARYEGANLIQGEAGTTVTLEVLGEDGAARTVEVERAELKNDPVESRMLEGKVGYVRLLNFYDHSAQRLEEAVTQLREQGAEALVFDMRNNGGGYLSQLTDMLDFLLPEGPIFISRDRAGHEEITNSDADCVELPMAVLVNAAGFGKFGTCADLTLQETCDMIDLNCRAAAALTAAVLPYMGRGSRVLEICSSAAFQPLPGFNVYAATKAFLLRYSRALRWEAAPRGIRVTAVCPGWIRTDFMDVARDTKNGRTVRSFPFAQRPETVARRALRNSRLLAVTTCGLPALVQRVASKFLPHCFIMACWEGLRRA